MKIRQKRGKNPVKRELVEALECWSGRGSVKMGPDTSIHANGEPSIQGEPNLFRYSVMQSHRNSFLLKQICSDFNCGAFYEPTVYETLLILNK